LGYVGNRERDRGRREKSKEKKGPKERKTSKKSTATRSLTPVGSPGKIDDSGALGIGGHTAQGEKAIFIPILIRRKTIGQNHQALEGLLRGALSDLTIKAGLKTSL